MTFVIVMKVESVFPFRPLTEVQSSFCWDGLARLRIFSRTPIYIQLSSLIFERCWMLQLLASRNLVVTNGNPCCVLPSCARDTLVQMINHRRGSRVKSYATIIYWETELHVAHVLFLPSFLCTLLIQSDWLDGREAQRTTGGSGDSETMESAAGETAIQGRAKNWCLEAVPDHAELIEINEMWRNNKF